MSDSKKGKDGSKTENREVEKSGNELSADDLENVAGGFLPAVNPLADKWVKLDVAEKIIGPVDGIAPALKK